MIFTKLIFILEESYERVEEPTIGKVHDGFLLETHTLTSQEITSCQATASEYVDWFVYPFTRWTTVGGESLRCLVRGYIIRFFRLEFECNADSKPNSHNLGVNCLTETVLGQIIFPGVLGIG